MPTGDTRFVVLYIYTCNANRVPLEQLLLGDQRLGYSIRLVVEQTYHPTGCRTGTSHPMTRDLLNYIYYMYCKSRATCQVLLGD